MIENMLKNSRYLVLLIVISCMLSSLILYISAINIIAHIIFDFFFNTPNAPSSGQVLAVMLLKSLDILLIALTFQVISVSHYRLFIADKNTMSSSWISQVFQINTFQDLKIILLKVAILVLALIFLEQVVEIGATIETLYLSVSVSLAIFAITFAIKTFKK